MKNDANIETIIKEVSNRLSKYLEENNNRKTHERFTILEEIYRNQKHFDAESLYLKMKKNSYSVSRATVYNTLDVLLECGLIKKHNFGEHIFYFEKTHGFPLHFHLVCTKCKAINEFEDMQILNLAEQYSNSISFRLNDLSLNLYGLCDLCQKA